MSQFSVAVVILNWNTRSLLEKYLPVVVKYTSMEEVELVVADNGSTDDSVEWLQHHFPQVKVLAFKDNLGFAGGYNKALSMLDAEFTVLLNSDAAPAPNWLPPLITAMRNNPLAAASVPRIKDDQRRGYFEYAGAAGGFIDRWGYPFCRGRIFDVPEKDDDQYHQADSVFWGSGSALMVRTSLFIESGGLDHHFFAHMEEIDWCWRVKNMGYKIIYIPESEVFHLGGGTLNYKNPAKTYLNFRNNLFLIIKNWQRSSVFGLLFFRMLLDYLASVHFLFRGEFRFSMAVYKAHWSFIKKIGYFYRQRQLLSGKVTIKQHPEIYQGSIVWDFFVRGKRYFSQLDFMKPDKSPKDSNFL